MRLVSHNWRHLSTRIVVAVLSALSFAACSDDAFRHTPAYAPLTQRIECRDTAGILQDITTLRHSDNSSLASPAQIDADALSASLALLQADYTLSATLADNAIAKIASRPDSASRPSLTLTAQMMRLKAEAQRRNDFLPDAIATANQGSIIARRAAATPQLVELTLVLAELRRDECDFKACLAELRKAEIAMDTARLEAFTPSQRISSLTRAAHVATDLCHIQAATRLLTKASEFFDKATDREKIDYLCQLTRLHILLGEDGKAQSALSRAEVIADKARIDYAKPTIKAYQSLVKSRKGDYEWAKFLLARTNPTKSPDENSFVAMLALAEVLSHEGDTHEAQTVLQDSVLIFDSSAPYLSVLYNDTRLALSLRAADYHDAFNIQTLERRKLITSYNDLFAFDDYRRSAELADALAALHAAELASANSASRTHLTVAIILLLLAAAATAYLYRTRQTQAGAPSLLSDAERLNYETQIASLRKQADMLEVTNGRITESIAYAEQIQHAISPSPDGLNNFPISGSFVFFSPLDVVSGDFFWYANRGSKLIVCCADCTGHGVPGALLSMMSATLLNNICANVSETDVDPGAILERLDAMLIDNLARNRELDANDGLDAALVVLDLVTHSVKVASARRPVIFVRSGELLTLRGSKRSVGEVEPIVRQRKFETSTVNLRKGDKIYMYTDGYSDQFGGQNGEKLKNSMVERFLAKISDDDMDQQSLAIQEMFVQWKGDLPQTDDVTFVGLSV